MENRKVSLCGMRVSEQVRDEALQTWPRRPPTGYDDRLWGAVCANHVLLIAREHGEESGSARQETHA